MSQLVSKAVGIDLGTTNSAVAVMNPADDDILIHRDPVTKSPTTPSCVWRAPGSAETIVGRKAVARKGGTPEPVSSVKRLMGTRAVVDLAGEQLSPQQVSSLILAEMKQQISADVAAFGGPASRWVVDRAVVTVPAYFDQPQIDATWEAAEAAGLEVLGLLHEPTAAASYHCWRTATRDGTFLVYDLGGGTFDVSVLRCTAGAFEVLGISGNNRLGGDDIDAAFARHLQEMLQADGWALDLDPERDQGDRSRFARLKVLAEGTKKALSKDFEYALTDSGLLIDKAGDPVVIETMVERAEFERIARPFIERTFAYCDEALARAQERAGISLADVDEVILAGGSTHMPLVREMVAAELCGPAAAGSARAERAKSAEPVYQEVDTVVALGAAVRAAAMGGLAISDERRTVRVNLRGTGSTGAAKTTIGGSVEALTPEVDLAAGRVVLTAGDYEDEVDLQGDGTFAFTRVPLQADAENSTVFEVYDAAGVLCARAERSIAQSSDLAPRDSLPIVPQNTKRISMEIQHDGRIERFPLVEVLQQLPFSKDYEFRHPGGAEIVELRLFQESRPIQVISVRVPRSTPKDTAILMHLVMHENYAITVEGSIGDTPYQADVRLPMEREMPSDDEIERLTSRFEEGIGVLPAGKRATARARFKMAAQAFREARSRDDAAQATHERDEMATIVESLGTADSELQPPKADFDGLVAICQELHAYFAQHGVPGGQPFDAEEIARSLEEHRRSGERAHTNRDQRSYSEAVEKLQGLLRYLAELERDRNEGITLSAAERAEIVLASVVDSARAVREMARNMHDAAVERELEALDTKLARLEPQIASNPRHVIEECGKLSARLSQLQRSLPTGGGSENEIALPTM
ncbi:MAG: Hsp70 family protein [Catenulispora sp.]